MTNRMRHLGVIVVILLTLISTVTVFAASKTVGGVRCTATKTIVVPLNWQGFTWESNIYSTAQSPIGTIGWTYWTDREFCSLDGTAPIWSRPHGSRASYGDNFEASTSINNFYSACVGGVQTIDTIGNHDFKNTNETWRPNVSASRKRP